MSEPAADEQPEAPAAPASSPDEAPAADIERGIPEPVSGREEPTVGTGSVLAIGCVVAMLLILVLGIVLVLWTR